MGSVTSSGLENVVAADTALSDVDGALGRLIIRGVSLDDLAGRATYPDVLTLLLAHQVPDWPLTLEHELGMARVAVAAHLEAVDVALLSLPPVEAMRVLLARIPDGAGLHTMLQLIAAPAVFIPCLLRIRQGLRPIAPDPALSHAADILRMLTGTMPAPGQAAALDTYLVTVSDHGLNASTFAARVVASTKAGLTSSILAALSALLGPLHGGAPGPVLNMLDAVGTPANAEPWLEQALERGDRLMGFGHRIYRVRDPRADALKGAVRALSAAGLVPPARLALAEAVEAAALSLLKRRKPNRPLETNVEFYTALLLEPLGFPREAFTGVFAMGRVGGWVAHAIEQDLTGRLIRPQSRYVGPVPQVRRAG